MKSDLIKALTKMWNEGKGTEFIIGYESKIWKSEKEPIIYTVKILEN